MAECAFPVPETYSLIANLNSLFVVIGISRGWSGKNSAISAGNVGKPPGIRNLPCYFPGKQGKERRDRFAVNFTLIFRREPQSLR